MLAFYVCLWVVTLFAIDKLPFDGTGRTPRSSKLPVEDTSRTFPRESNPEDRSCKHSLFDSGPERVVFPERFEPPLQHRPPPEHVVNTDPEHIQGPPIIIQSEKKCTHHVIQQPVFMPQPVAHEERIQQVSIGHSPLHAWTRYSSQPVSVEVKADLIRLQASPKSTLSYSPQIKPQISSADKHSKYDAIYYASTTNGMDV